MDEKELLEIERDGEMLAAAAADLERRGWTLTDEDGEDLVSVCASVARTTAQFLPTENVCSGTLQLASRHRNADLPGKNVLQGDFLDEFWRVRTLPRV